MVRFHFWATIVWGLLLIPTLLWLKDSIIWITIMSWYAIVVGHWSSYQAARAEKKIKEVTGNDPPEGSGTPAAGGPTRVSV